MKGCWRVEGVVVVVPLPFSLFETEAWSENLRRRER